MAIRSQTVHVSLSQSEGDCISITPWISYQVTQPTRPLPALAQRPALHTAHLIVRPILPSDAPQFAALRQLADPQRHSPVRGRADRDAEESQANLARLQAPHDARHWYFGAWLAASGELVGEGGIPDCEECPTSGWTRFEILLKPGFRRMGYGTEFFRAIMESWWDLPWELRRHQLLPYVAGNKEPGAKITDCVECFWEDDNVAARNFFTRTLEQDEVSHEGTFEMMDWRDGREKELLRWGGTIIANPRPKTQS